MMKLQLLGRWLLQKRRWCLVVALLLAAAALVAISLESPELKQLLATTFTRGEPAHTKDDGHAEADHDHLGNVQLKPADGDEQGSDHANGAKAKYDHPHDETTAIKLSQQALENIGLRTGKVELKSFEQTITVPGIIVERPGWSRVIVTSPMTGVITRVYPLQGEAVKPGEPLFEVRLTHEDLLQAQSEFLRTVEELDVIRREVKRLEEVTAQGAVAGKTLLERQYEQQKLEAHFRAQEQALLLHGLSSEQIADIASARNLVQSLTVRAPLPPNDSLSNQPEHFFQVRDLTAAQGKSVNAGDTLCTLVNYSELYAEGRAFEQDVRIINEAAAQGWAVSVILGAKAGGGEESLADLKILYLDDNVDAESRTFRFYVPITNRLLRVDEKSDGRHFAYWQFRPGQRIQIRIPVQRWDNRIILPVEAVAQEGVEVYVFEANGDHFHRRPIRIEYRDQNWVVIANDGTLKLGSTVAISAAQKLQLALKAKAGGVVDPHAGHNH